MLCKDCNREVLEVAVPGSGYTVRLDRRAPVYGAWLDPATNNLEGRRVAANLNEGTAYFVLHSEVCPKKKEAA